MRSVRSSGTFPAGRAKQAATRILVRVQGPVNGWPTITRWRVVGATRRHGGGSRRSAKARADRGEIIFQVGLGALEPGLAQGGGHRPASPRFRILIHQGTTPSGPQQPGRLRQHGAGGPRRQLMFQTKLQVDQIDAGARQSGWLPAAACARLSIRRLHRAPGPTASIWGESRGPLTATELPTAVFKPIL